MDLIERIMCPISCTGSVFPSAMYELWHDPLIRNIASYIVKVYAGNGYYLNYADCSPLPGRRTARDFLFGVRTGETALAAFAARDYRDQTWDERLLPKEENLYIHLLQIFSHDEMMRYPAAAPAIPDAWFESTGLMVARDDSFVLAAKAGNNGENHNHNDVGSVILYKDGDPFLIDLGVETYTAKTFSEKRYEIWTMQSSWHNLPAFFDGDQEVMQKAGREYRASCVRHESNEDYAFLEMDLAGAYKDPRIGSYLRRVTLRRGLGVEITDTYTGSLPCALTLMTYEEPVVEQIGESDMERLADRSPDKMDADDTGCKDARSGDSTAKKSAGCAQTASSGYTRAAGKTYRIMVGKTGTILVAGAGRIETHVCPIRDPRLAAAWKHDCWRIRIHFEGIRIRLWLSGRNESGGQVP